MEIFAVMMEFVASVDNRLHLFRLIFDLRVDNFHAGWSASTMWVITDEHKRVTVLINSVQTLDALSLQSFYRPLILQQLSSYLHCRSM